MIRIISRISRFTDGPLLRRVRPRIARLGHGDSVMARFLVTVLLGVVLGHAIIFDWLSYALVAGVGLLWLIVVVERPYIGLVTLIALTSSVVPEDRLPVLKMGGNVHVFDLMLGFLLALIFVKRLVKREFTFVRTPLDLPVILFAASSIVACWTATRLGVDALVALPGTRIILLYLTFFIVTNLVRDEHALGWLVKALFVLAVITAVVMVTQAAVGSSVQFMPGLIGSVDVAGQQFSGISRVEAPGIMLVQFMLVAASALWAMGDSRISPLVLMGIVGLATVAIALTFYRGGWVAALFSLGLVFLVTPPARRARIIMGLLAAIVVLLIVGAFSISTGGKMGTYAAALGTRAESLFSGDALMQEQDTWDNRILELKDALRVIPQHLVFGIGFANPYRTGGRFTGDVGTWIHNGYAFVLLKMGLLGFVPFVSIFVIFLRRGLHLWKGVRHPSYRALSLGLTAGFAGLMLANISDPRLVGNLKWTPVCGVILGINEVIYRLCGAKNTQEVPSIRMLDR
jgi:O-antigen ligase